MSLRSKLSEYKHIFSKNCMALLSTISKDGTPHTTPLWVEYNHDDLTFAVNIEENSVKDYNIRRNPNVSLTVIDPDNIYHYVQIRGVVKSRKYDIGNAMSKRLFSKYSGGKVDEAWFTYPNPLLMITIEPRKISGWSKDAAYEFKQVLEKGL